MKSFYELWKEVEAHQGHVGTGGIQRHSAGEIFPLRVQIKAHGLSGSGRIQVMAPGGEMVADEEYGSMDEFKDAHRRAEYIAKQFLRKQQ